MPARPTFLDSVVTNRENRSFRKKPRHRTPRYPTPDLRLRLSSLSSALRSNQDLLRNASSLAATSGLTSFLGFAYWIYAARVFSSEAVGYGTAAISAMLLLGSIGLFGLDTMLIGELPRSSNRGELMMASSIAAFIGSLVLGLGFALVSLALGTRFAEINGSVGRIALFSLGVAITGATFVFDAGTIGLMRGGLQLSRNVAVSIAKMVALPATALILHDRLGVGIMLAWVIGTVVSMLPVTIMIKRGGDRILYRPDWIGLWRLRKVALAHNWLNLSINIPVKLMAVLVVIVVSPTENGAYYIATMISSFLYMIPQSLSTVLFAVASAAPDKIAEKLRFVLRMSMAIGIPGGLALALCARFLLTLFKPSYAELATGPLLILIVAYLPGLPNTVYIAVARATGRINQAAVFLTVFAVIRMAALVVGGKIDGLYGLSYGMLAVVVVQSLITTPSVLRTAYGSVIVRSGADSVTPSAARLRSAELAEEMRVQQEAGLAALIALAAKTASSESGPDRDSPRAKVPIWLGSTRPQSTARAPNRYEQPTTNGNPAFTDTNRRRNFDDAPFRSEREGRCSIRRDNDARRQL
jgi:O-antigen/teichoic acid export membrane protein